MKHPKFMIYPTLLDNWSYFLGSDMSEEDFIRRVNGEEPAGMEALQGTAFNNAVDLLCEGSHVHFQALQDGRFYYRCDAYGREGESHSYFFDMELVNGFFDLYKDALLQQYLEFIADTPAGPVKFYGYADGVFPSGVRDIKTTKRYEAFKYRKKWQPWVYLHALAARGCRPESFTFDVTDFTDVWHEFYRIQDFPLEELLEEAGELCRWLEAHKELIKKQKLFNYRYV